MHRADFCARLLRRVCRNARRGNATPTSNPARVAAAVTTSRVRVGGHVGLGVGEATHDLQPIAILARHWSANGDLPGVTPRRDLMRDSLLALCAAKSILPPSFLPRVLISSLVGEITRVGRNPPSFHPSIDSVRCSFRSNSRRYIRPQVEGNRKWSIIARNR